MSYARANLLPPNSQNIETLKALCKLQLEKYISLRKADWNSYLGMFKKFVKSGIKLVSLGKYGSIDVDTWKLLKECDEIKKEIEGLSNYADVVNLIYNLNEKAISGINEQIPLISNPSERANTYYAINSLLQEMMRTAFSEDYEADVIATKSELQHVKSERQRRFNNSLTVADYDKNIDKLLIKLVMLGDLDVYHEAFYQKNHLFPQFKRISGTTAYVTQADISQYMQWINNQRSKTYLRQNAGVPKVLVKDQLPNVNIPYHMQPFFALIHLKRTHDLALEDCANFAKIDPIIRPNTTFFARYALDPKSFDAKNDPKDTTEINADDEAELLKIQQQEVELGDLQPVELGQVALASQDGEVESDADTEDLETINLDTINVVDEKPAVTVYEVPPPPSLPVQNNNIVAPDAIPAPTPPKVSQIGKFGQSSPKSEGVSPARQSLDEDAADYHLPKEHNESDQPEQSDQPKAAPNRKNTRKR